MSHDPDQLIALCNEFFVLKEASENLEKHLLKRTSELELALENANATVEEKDQEIRYLQSELENLIVEREVFCVKNSSEAMPPPTRAYSSLKAIKAILESSGIAVDEACLAAFQDLKLRKKYRFVTFCLGDENRKIVIEKVAEKVASYEEFLKELPEDDCRYAIFDFEYQKSADEGIRSKICFIVWSPDTAKVKQKMLYAASKDALRKTLVGISTEVQATDPSEISYDAVLEKVTSI